MVFHGTNQLVDGPVPAFDMWLRILTNLPLRSVRCVFLNKYHVGKGGIAVGLGWCWGGVGGLDHLLLTFIYF